MCDKHDRSDLLGSPKHLLFSVAILLSISSVGHAETTIKFDFMRRHLETLERLDQLAHKGEFYADQVKSGECSDGPKIGTSVRVDKRIKHPNGAIDVCIVPLGSSEPCQWISSKVIK
jgi:hypothetical protein